MALTIPTTQQIANVILSGLESNLNQETPALRKAFNKVLSRVVAGVITILYKFGAERAKQCLALTATGDDLKDIARNYGVEPKGAASAVLTYTVNSSSTVPATIDWVGDPNGVRYRADSDAIPSGGVATITGTAQTPGTAGNLNVSDTLTIGTQNAGTENQATVTDIVDTGAEEETDDELRIRVLDKIRTEGGGGNSADYREWAQETEGVARAYPYAGNPTFLETGSGSALPGERTVYIQASTSIDADGIAPQSLLDDARDMIRFDPDDNDRAREPLPLTNDTLYVESIIRTQFNVEITGLDVDADLEAQTKTDISTALTVYFNSLFPFIDGLDAEEDKNNKITDPTITEVVQNVVGSAGGTFTSLAFNVGASNIPEYTLQVNELAKLGTVTYP
jgi:uncharacterized phage protein gp47/JayE